MKTSRVQTYTFINEWVNPHGNKNVFYHKVVMANGDSGNIGFSEKYSSKIKVGDEITYNIDEKGKLTIQDAVAPPQPPPTAIPNADMVKQQTMASKTNVYGKKPEDFLGYVMGYSKDIICQRIAVGDKKLPANKIVQEMELLSRGMYDIVKKLLAEG